MTPEQADLSIGQVLGTVTAACNIFSVMLSSIVIYNFYVAICNAKKKRDVAKKKLYVYSILFVSQQMSLALFVQLCVRFPKHAAYFDFFMEIYSLFAIYFFF